MISGVSWKGQAARLTVQPEEGMEVIATGRLTTFLDLLAEFGNN